MSEDRRHNYRHKLLHVNIVNNTLVNVSTHKNSCVQAIKGSWSLQSADIYFRIKGVFERVNKLFLKTWIFGKKVSSITDASTDFS